RGKSLQLVVIMHAWLSSSEGLRDVRNAVEGSMPDADTLVPDYPAGLFSQADPTLLSNELTGAIRRAVERRAQSGTPYQEIILIGHSLAALIVRKAYVFARGQTHDVPGAGGMQYKEAPWARLVTRIILLAGTNRGWSLDEGTKLPSERQLSWPRRVGFRTMAFLYQWLHLGRLVNGVHRGSPFVANL